MFVYMHGQVKNISTLNCEQWGFGRRDFAFQVIEFRVIGNFKQELHFIVHLLNYMHICAHTTNIPHITTILVSHLLWETESHINIHIYKWKKIKRCFIESNWDA